MSIASVLTNLTDAAKNSLGISRVYGEPVTAEGVTLIPVATVIGVHGVGMGEGPVPTDAIEVTDADGEVVEEIASDGEGSGGGGGFTSVGWPAGAYVMSNGEATWRPAVDANIVILAGASLAGCVVASLASVAAIRAISSGTEAVVRTGAEAFGSVTQTVAQSVTGVASHAAGAFTHAASHAAGAFTRAAELASGAFGHATDAATHTAVTGAETAARTALGLGELGASALEATTHAVGGAIAAARRTS
ncbi:hypothetical protein [Serinibacter salmoneus]|uniref:Uncharacterized protein n=1 Tax=Serinibacter salmoneus TaxID=556530 RepID=A0A2A9CYA7_9MICO|nr:hypothetical protein [Serinibacter salmoneus]PFG19414.1 hypothetical protein ATL40_0974 [Serinibacter salmoneus]